MKRFQKGDWVVFDDFNLMIRQVGQKKEIENRPKQIKGYSFHEDSRGPRSMYLTLEDDLVKDGFHKASRYRLATSEEIEEERLKRIFFPLKR